MRVKTSQHNISLSTRVHQQPKRFSSEFCSPEMWQNFKLPTFWSRTTTAENWFVFILQKRDNRLFGSKFDTIKVGQLSFWLKIGSNKKWIYFWHKICIPWVMEIVPCVALSSPFKVMRSQLAPIAIFPPYYIHNISTSQYFHMFIHNISTGRYFQIWLQPWYSQYFYKHHNISIFPMYGSGHNILRKLHHMCPLLSDHNSKGRKEFGKLCLQPSIGSSCFSKSLLQWKQ